MEIYEQARRRVDATPALARHRQTIMDEWTENEGDEHWHWVVEADEEEIVRWAEEIQQAIEGEAEVSAWLNR